MAKIWGLTPWVAKEVSRQAFGRLMSGAPRRKGDAKAQWSIVVASLDYVPGVCGRGDCWASFLNRPWLARQWQQTESTGTLRLLTASDRANVDRPRPN
jgi:hypothetical protein